ncbi:MAG TPA: glycoside hydrolase family 3 N-terminal domain-containing protein [Candidatus Sulfotelmatobacter sp.]|nr:glycoside hydrolase family 3 N-terminal domain-containing protein [Candidatus Sulfotelmatobacter sp.]
MRAVNGIQCLFALGLLGIAGAAPAQTAAQTASVRRSSGIDNPAIEKRVDSLLKQMTMEEKIGQLVQYSAGQPTGPGTGRTDYVDMIAHGQIGSLFNVTDPHQINTYQHIAMEKTRLHIPILFGLDVIHGFKTEFPIPLGLASTWDPSLVEKAAHVAAMEAAADGIRWTFHPMVDIARDARWGRMSEGAGEDPFLGSAMAAAYVRGYQGSRLDAPDTMAACVKHFVGYGAAEGGRDYNTTEITEHTLREYYLPPFHAAEEAGAATFMSAFNALGGTPSTANAFTLKQVLKKEWGFRGFVVSDWNSIGELIPQGIANDGETAARKAFLAGVDMDMVSSFYHDNLQKIVRSGQATQAELNDSVRRVLRVKFALGLFEHPFVDEAAAPKALFHPDSLATAQTAAERSFVLLKNANGSDGKPLLPLSKGRKIAVIGPLGDDSTYPDGAPDYAGPRTSFSTSLAERIGKDHVSRFKGTGILNGADAEIAEAVAGAQQADLAILALGETQDMSGEAASRAHLGLPGKQEELLEKVMATGKPVVLILFSGRPLTLPWAFEHVPAVMAAWFPGISGGPALVRTLFGDVNPSGRLVVSWPRSVGQEPLYYNALDTGRPPIGIDLTKPPHDVPSRYVSRYIDEQNSPQFPFGYGESYTTFSFGATNISTPKLSASALNRNLKGAAAMVAEADITNTGSRSADELVQLYIRLQGTSVAEPVRALKAFQTVPLAPGETKHVKFELKPETFAFWNSKDQFAAEPSKLTVWISPDSAHGTPAEAEILP